MILLIKLYREESSLIRKVKSISLVLLYQISIKNPIESQRSRFTTPRIKSALHVRKTFFRGSLRARSAGRFCLLSLSLSFSLFIQRDAFNSIQPSNEAHVTAVFYPLHCASPGVEKRLEGFLRALPLSSDYDGKRQRHYRVDKQTVVSYFLPFDFPG